MKKMEPEQLQNLVEKIINGHANQDVLEAGIAHAERHGYTVSYLTDRVSMVQMPVIPRRKLNYDRVRRAARSLASSHRIEMRRTPEHGVTFNPIISTRS